MNPTDLEMLSRHLDGDLGPEEERELKTRLEVEPELLARLKGMRRLRDVVSALAADEKPPAKLDDLVKPLLLGRLDPLSVRPWVRWFAMAAVVVLAASVVIEVNRRNPGPNVASIAQTSQSDRADSGKRFTLAPLPTSALPPDQQPLGASDRLLASPIPEVRIDEPSPLEVLGPLEMGEGDTRHFDDSAATAEAERAPARIGAAAGKGGEDHAAAIEEKDDRKQPASGKARQDVDGGGRRESVSSWEEWKKGRARLFIFIDGESAWQEFSPDATCKPGRYAVRVLVNGGVVRESRPVGGAASASPTQRLCAGDLVIGLHVDQVADGQYPAEVVIEPPGIRD